MFKALVNESTSEDDHVPFLEINENKVSVRCGYNALHPMKSEHFIGWIKLFGIKGQKQLELGSAQFWPEHAEPVALFSVADIKQYDKLVGVSYCNVHGIFESEIAVE